MAAQAVCMDTYHRAPTLHYVTSADDVIHCYSHRPNVAGRSAVDRRGAWSSHRDHQDSAARQQMSRTSNSSGPGRGEVLCCRRKLSVDDGLSSRPAAAGVVAASRRRALPTSASDDVPSVEDWSFNRRRLSAWSPVPVSTLSRTLSEHTLDRSARYRGADCRDDMLDDCSVDESIWSPPRIAPVSGQLSLVCLLYVTWLLA